MTRPKRVSRVVVGGPLAPFAELYREALVTRRYTSLSMVNLQRQVRQLSQWLDAQNLGVERIGEGCIETSVCDLRVRGRSATLSRPGLSC